MRYYTIIMRLRSQHYDILSHNYEIKDNCDIFITTLKVKHETKKPKIEIKCQNDDMS